MRVPDLPTFIAELLSAMLPKSRLWRGFVWAVVIGLGLFILFARVWNQVTR